MQVKVQVQSDEGRDWRLHPCYSFWLYPPASLILPSKLLFGLLFVPQPLAAKLFHISSWILYLFLPSRKSFFSFEREKKFSTVSLFTELLFYPKSSYGQQKVKYCRFRGWWMFLCMVNNNHTCHVQRDMNLRLRKAFFDNPAPPSQPPPFSLRIERQRTVAWAA